MPPRSTRQLLCFANVEGCVGLLELTVAVRNFLSLPLFYSFHRNLAGDVHVTVGRMGEDRIARER